MVVCVLLLDKKDKRVLKSFVHGDQYFQVKLRNFTIKHELDRICHLHLLHLRPFIPSPILFIHEQELLLRTIEGLV